MKRCFVFSAGEFYGLREQPCEDDLVIAADAGLLNCKKAGVKPSITVGDFDSMPKPDNKTSRILCAPVEKDDTDTMLAVRIGLEKGCKEFHFYGATGGERPDHTLANIQALAFLCRNKSRGYLYDRDFVFTVIENTELIIHKTVEWGLVSLFSLSDKVEGVTLKGLQYPLSDADLTNTFPLGVSNHIVDNFAVITVKNGLLLVGWALPCLNSGGA